MTLRTLRGNCASRAPSNICVVDTETLPHPHPSSAHKVIHRLNLGVAIAGRLDHGDLTRRHELGFDDAPAFWTWLVKWLSPKQPLYLFAHSLGFDATVLGFWESLESRQWSIDPPPGRGAAGPGGAKGARRKGILATDDPPTIIECWHVATASKLVMLDTMNWHRESLEKLAAHYGLAKEPLPAWDAPRSCWWERCQSDAEILLAVVIDLLRWHKTEKLGNWAYTVNQQAMHAYRHRHLPSRTTIQVSDDLGAKAWARGALYAARQRVHWQGRITDADAPVPLSVLTGREGPNRPGPVHVLDVSSCYPSVMRGNLYPAALVRSVEGPNVDQLARLLRGYGAVAAVEVDSPHEPWPVRSNGRVWWVTGRFWTLLCGPELCRAVAEGHVRAVGRVQLYRTAELFTSYVDEWWRKRQEAPGGPNGPFGRLAKGMLLGLHGKWGQKSYRWTLCPGHHCPGPWLTWHEPGEPGEPPVTYRSVGWEVQRLTEGLETHNGFPEITAWVNSYARERMRALCHVAGDEGLIWEDADQLAVDDLGLARLTAAGEVADGVMGKLRPQWSARQGVVGGVRDYQLDDRRVITGLSHRAVLQADGTYRQEEWGRLDAALSGPPIGGVQVETCDRRRPQPSRCGTMRESGHVQPFRVEDIPDAQAAH